MTPPRSARPLALLALAALGLPGCASDPDPPPPPAPAVVRDTAAVPPGVVPLLGVWDLRDSDPALGRCSSASVGFRADGRYLSRSGDLVVTGRYVASPAVVSGRSGFFVAQRAEAHNGEPNCQGVPGEASVLATPAESFYEVVGDRAHLYYGPPTGRPAAVLVRRTLPS